MINKLPNFEEFKRDVTNIFPDGNIVDAYDELKRTLRNKTYKDGTESGEELTYSFLIEKWNKLIQLWLRKHGGKEDKYISKAILESKVNFQTFLEDDLFNNEYSLDKGTHERDKYLFPAWMDTSSLYDLTQEIKRHLNKRKNDIADGKIKK